MRTIADAVNEFDKYFEKTSLPLAWINFDQEPPEAISSLIALINKYPTIQEITLKGIVFTNIEKIKPLFDAIAQLSVQQPLTQLDLSCNDFGKADLQKITFLIDFLSKLKVKKVDISKNYFENTSSDSISHILNLFVIILKNQYLESFVCIGNGLGILPESIWPSLCQAIQTSHLIKLDLSDNDLYLLKNNLVILCQSIASSNIKSIDLAENELGKTGLEDSESEDVDFCEKALIALFNSSIQDVDLACNSLEIIWDGIEPVFDTIIAQEKLLKLSLFGNNLNLLVNFNMVQYFNFLINFIGKNRSVQRLRLESNRMPEAVTNRVRTAIKNNPVMRFIENDLYANEGAIYASVSSKAELLTETGIHKQTQGFISSPRMYQNRSKIEHNELLDEKKIVPPLKN